ncbi:3-hydroxyacyl-ACP dehydratase FabZ [Chlamydiifrater phoenicopteri]|uniref:3-hydroxyacyl-ACP dehydratase FabZ n=1 Tax=Chlamydiifrater phoenicopteri TaxID=2681469 RepID=UPI001BCE729D|nr:3-hydroxyacyl-ACP dehydratase FabZ [Chlamydiifrater phoenicopteri]
MSDKGLSVRDILDLLPHRFPFLLVDRVVSYNFEEKTITAQKNVSFNEQFFVGHFPEAPIMPGVLIIEALAQAAGLLLGMLLTKEEREKKVSLFLGIKEAKFRQAVKPGDILTLQANFSVLSAKGGKAEAKAFVDSGLAAEASISFALVDKASI